MFGYLKAYKEKLNEEELKIYQGYYCGLCETLGEKFGKLSRMILAYDPVYLALIDNSLYEEEEQLRSGLCLFKKGVKTTRVRSVSLDYAADMNLMLAYHNFRDKVLDSGSRKAAYAVRLLKPYYEETAARYDRQRTALDRYMEALQSFEREPIDNPDLAANLTGEMLSEVFLMREDSYTRYLKPHLFYLGKCIYLMDAYEDVQEDIRTGAYNPYASRFESPGFEENVRAHLEAVMGECARYFEMLPLVRHASILRNIVYSGVWEAYASVHKKRLEQAQTKQE